MPWTGCGARAAAWSSGSEPPVIAGLPPSAWLLLAASVGIGLAIELAFYVHRKRR